MIITNINGNTKLEETTADASKIFKGYTAYNGDKEKMTGIFDFSSATVDVAKILSGYKAWDGGGNLITGNYTPPADILTYLKNSSNGGSASTSNSHSVSCNLNSSYNYIIFACYNLYSRGTDSMACCAAIGIKGSVTMIYSHNYSSAAGSPSISYGSVSHSDGNSGYPTAVWCKIS